MGIISRAILTWFALPALSCLAVVTEAKVVVVSGSATTKPNVTANPIPIERGDTVTVGSTIETEEKSEVLMTPVPGSAVRVLEKNSVVLTEGDLQKKGETVLGRKAKLQLNRGTVQVGLDKIGGTSDFKITTPQCVAAARGTIFGTTATGDATTVVVLEGIVSVPWTDGKGNAHAPDVRAKMKVTIKNGPDGRLRQEGPKRATDTELSALREFTKFAQNWNVLQRLAGGAIRGGNGVSARTGAPLPVAPPQSLVSP